MLEALKDLTGGRGPDACIDAVGMEAHTDLGPLQAYDRVKQAVRLETDAAPRCARRSWPAATAGPSR